MMSFQVKFLNEAITVELQQFGDVSGKIPLSTKLLGTCTGWLHPLKMGTRAVLVSLISVI